MFQAKTDGIYPQTELTVIYVVDQSWRPAELWTSFLTIITIDLQ